MRIVKGLHLDLCLLQIWRAFHHELTFFRFFVAAKALFRVLACESFSFTVSAIFSLLHINSFPSQNNFSCRNILSMTSRSRKYVMRSRIGSEMFLVVSTIQVLNDNTTCTLQLCSESGSLRRSQNSIAWHTCSVKRLFPYFLIF